MPQVDYNLENVAFQPFRQELNNSLQSAIQLNSGATAPSTSYPFMFWADTVNNELKLRSGSNNSWFPQGRLNQPFWGITPADISALNRQDNLNDVVNKSIARSNLGISSPSANYLINPGFRINQRGGNLYAFAASVKTLDHWGFTAAGGSGGTIAAGSISQQNFVAGQTIVPGEPLNFIRITNTNQGSSLGTDSYHVFGQPIEDVRTLGGQVCTVSFWARSTITGKTIGIELGQNFGVGGSAFTSAGGTTRNLSTIWQQFTATFTMPSVSSKVIGAGHFVTLLFWLQAGSSMSSRAGGSFGWQGTGDIEIAQVQLEAGSVATPLGYRLLAEELSLCQRYFEINEFYSSGYGLAGANPYISQPFKQTKRVTPTIVGSASNSLNVPFVNCVNPGFSAHLTVYNIGITVSSTGSYSFGLTVSADAEYFL